MRKQRVGEKGIALVMALIITLVAFLVVGTTLYLVTQSTTMSGAGKSYASAEEGADSIMEVAKEYITLVNEGEILPPLFTSDTCQGQSYTIAYAVTAEGAGDCTAALDLPGAAGATYTATVTVRRLYSVRPAGARIPFAELATSATKPAVFYRIVTRVENRVSHAVAESAALYRYVPK